MAATRVDSVSTVWKRSNLHDMPGALTTRMVPGPPSQKGMRCRRAFGPGLIVSAWVPFVRVSVDLRVHVDVLGSVDLDNARLNISKQLRLRTEVPNMPRTASPSGGMNDPVSPTGTFLPPMFLRTIVPDMVNRIVSLMASSRSGNSASQSWSVRRCRVSATLSSGLVLCLLTAASTSAVSFSIQVGCWAR